MSLFSDLTFLTMGYHICVDERGHRKSKPVASHSLYESLTAANYEKFCKWFLAMSILTKTVTDL